MFQIKLTLVNDNFTGLEAHEIRTRLGLSEGTSAYFTTDYGQSGAHIPCVPVDEAFARAWFTPTQETSSAAVPSSMLVTGDARLATQQEHNNYAITFTELPVERVKELYVAVRFAACRAQVARLTEELAELKAKSEFGDE